MIKIALIIQSARPVKNFMTTSTAVPPALPAPRRALHPVEAQDQRRAVTPEAARRRTIARGIRFGHAALAYTHCQKLARPPLTPRFDISA